MIFRFLLILLMTTNAFSSDQRWREVERDFERNTQPTLSDRIKYLTEARRVGYPDRSNAKKQFSIVFRAALNGEVDLNTTLFASCTQALDDRPTDSFYRVPDSIFAEEAVDALYDLRTKHPEFSRALFGLQINLPSGVEIHVRVRNTDETKDQFLDSIFGQDRTFNALHEEYGVDFRTLFVGYSNVREAAMAMRSNLRSPLTGTGGYYSLTQMSIKAFALMQARGFTFTRSSTTPATLRLHSRSEGIDLDLEETRIQPVGMFWSNQPPFEMFTAAAGAARQFLDSQGYVFLDEAWSSTQESILRMLLRGEFSGNPKLNPDHFVVRPDAISVRDPSFAEQAMRIILDEWPNPKKLPREYVTLPSGANVPFPVLPRTLSKKIVELHHPSGRVVRFKHRVNELGNKVLDAFAEEGLVSDLLPHSVAAENPLKLEDALVFLKERYGINLVEFQMVQAGPTAYAIQAKLEANNERVRTAVAALATLQRHGIRVDNNSGKFSFLSKDGKVLRTFTDEEVEAIPLFSGWVYTHRPEKILAAAILFFENKQFDRTD